MVRLTPKTIEAGKLRRVCGRQAAGGHDAVGRRNLIVVADFQHPTVRGLVEHGRMDPRAKLDVAAEVEPVGDVVGVAQDLRLRRIALRPHPLLL
jgi:hypothetical protein